MSDAWFMPYQSTYYILFNELTGKRKLYIDSEMLKFNLISVGFRIVAVFISIPFWRYLGLL